MLLGWFLEAWRKEWPVFSDLEMSELLWQMVKEKIKKKIPQTGRAGLENPTHSPDGLRAPWKTIRNVLAKGWLFHRVAFCK